MSAVLFGEDGDFEAGVDKLVENSWDEDASGLYQDVSFRHGIGEKMEFGDWFE